MFHSIKWRTATAFALITVICVGGVSGYLAHFLRQSHLESLETQLTAQAQMLGSACAAGLRSGDSDTLQDVLLRMGQSTDTRMVLLDNAGAVLANPGSPIMDEVDRNAPEVVMALYRGEGSDIRRSEELGQDAMYVAVPVVYEGQDLGIAVVSASLGFVGNYLGQVTGAIVAGAAISAFAVVALSLQITKVTSGPVNKLTRLSRKVAEGELDQEIEVVSVDEVGELAQAFNAMVGRIREMMSIVTKERDRMATILSEMGDGIFVVDVDSRVAVINPAAERMLRVTNVEVLGKPFVEVVRDYELDELIKNCLKTGRQLSANVETSPQKQFLWVFATPLEQESGCLVLLRDLTELRRLERVRQDFVSNISHELRTPIASVKALAETLQRGAVDDLAVSRDFLAKINTEADRLAQMVQELADLARIESGQVTLERKAFSISDAIVQVVDRLQPQADAVNVRLNVDTTSDIPQAWGDTSRIEQVLVNIVHNAIKFTPAGGDITVSARGNGREVMVSVADTGVGIPSDDLPRIFERFYKADRARSGGGTGLGLAIAKHIVEAHDGRIWADSLEGKGSTFSFVVPAAPQEDVDTGQALWD